MEPSLLASNTSGLPIAEVGAALDRPGDFLGMHFFNPVWSMPLVEIVRTVTTRDGQVSHARMIAAAIDKAMELGYRHPMGPLRLTDFVGLDVRLDIARNL